MAVTIHTSVMKYKNNSGEYVDINGIGLEFIDDEATQDETRGWSTKKLTEELAKKTDVSTKAQPNGIATLDGSGKVPMAQLPSYVDDVIEYVNRQNFPAIGETGKIYVDTSTNTSYRWSGSTYTAIAYAINLGETSEDAYRGDRGKIAYDHATAKGSAFSNNLYKMTTNVQGHVTAATPVTKYDLTALGVPDITVVEIYVPGETCDYDNYRYYRPSGSNDGKIYHCIKNGTTTDPTDSTKWEEVTVTGELQKIKDKLYEPIVVSSLSVSPATAEIGSSVASVTLTYALNKAAQAMTLDGVAIPNTDKTGTIAKEGPWTSDKTFSVTATDEKDYTSAAKTASLKFYNNAIWGVASAPQTVDSTFVMGLSNKTLTNSRSRTINVNAASGQHIWYAVPTRLGACTFTVGGFAGGFSSRETVSVTNNSGYTENYYVYKSDNTGLGSTSVVVS